MIKLTHVRHAMSGIFAAIALVSSAGCASSGHTAGGLFGKLTREQFEQSLTCDPTDTTCACVVDTSLEFAKNPKWTGSYRSVRQSIGGGASSSEMGSMVDQILFQTLMIDLMSDAAEACGADPSVVTSTITVS